MCSFYTLHIVQYTLLTHFTVNFSLKRENHSDLINPAGFQSLATLVYFSLYFYIIFFVICMDYYSSPLFCLYSRTGGRITL